MNLISHYFNKFLLGPLKIKFFFLFSFIFFALIVASISFLISYKYEQTYLNNYIKTQAESEINSKTNYLKNTLDLQRRFIRSLKNNDIFQQYIQSGFVKNKKESINLFEQVMNSSNNIMQLRFIQNNGMENIRLERFHKGDKFTIIPKENLQNKKNRYYFQEVSKLGKHSDIWVSNIDLNIENNTIQVPYVPTIRIAAPIYTENKFQGIVIINLFMHDILKTVAKSNLFWVSLIDNEGHFIIGTNEIGGKIEDYSWSKYLLKQITIKDILPSKFDSILNSFHFNSQYVISQKISKQLNLIEDITMVLKVKTDKITELKKTTMHKILDILVIVLLVSGPISFLLAYILSLLATKVLQIRQDMNEKSHLYDRYLEAMNVNNIISKSDLRGKITFVNDNFTKVSGYTKEEAIGKPHALLRHPDTSKQTFKEMWLTIQAGKTWTGILRNKKKNGDFYDVDIAIMPIFNEKNEIMACLAGQPDITNII